MPRPTYYDLTGEHGGDVAAVPREVRTPAPGTYCDGCHAEGVETHRVTHRTGVYFFCAVCAPEASKGSE